MFWRNILMELQTKVTDIACLPNRANPTDAGLDLRSTIPYILVAGETKLFDTGVAFKIPEGFVGLVFARSGMGKHNVSPANCVGVIDSSYRGNIKINLCNYSTQDYNIERYDRIGQIVIMPIALPTLELVNMSDADWLDTERGADGFGSTGTK
jgi:dUTP pyrophosphatase